MLFNSPVFLFAYLPLTLAGFFAVGLALGHRFALAWLLLASLFFYAWWKPVFVLLLLGSIVGNYLLGRWILRRRSAGRNAFPVLAFGIAANVAALGYFKYTGFLFTNFAALLGTGVPAFALDIVLPLGISFFTFQQIAYLVDTFRGETHEESPLVYSLFVSFFPHAIAGPIVHHQIVLPQFSRPEMAMLRPDNVARGLFLLTIGLVKKMVIADTFSPWVAAGFDSGVPLTMVEAWTTSLAYTFQLYFDFSGYADMAVGLGIMFNISLPYNFNSPYRATSITDFWRRWHITLTWFLRTYIYFPLGGNRAGEARTYLNIALVFLIGGIWHGAGWTFVIWGALHGGAMVIHRAWERFGRPLPAALGWILTFGFVHIAWVFFRAKDVSHAMNVLGPMFGRNGVDLSLGQVFPRLPVFVVVAMFAGLFAVCLQRVNSNRLFETFTPSWRVGLAVVASWYLIYLTMGRSSEFIYFQF